MRTCFCIVEINEAGGKELHPFGYSYVRDALYDAKKIAEEKYKRSSVAQTYITVDRDDNEVYVYRDGEIISRFIITDYLLVKKIMNL